MKIGWSQLMENKMEVGDGLGALIKKNDHMLWPTHLQGVMCAQGV